MATDPDERPPVLRKMLKDLNAPPCWGHFDQGSCANMGNILKPCRFKPSCKKRTGASHMHKYERGLIDKSTAKDMIKGKKVSKKEDPDYDKRKKDFERLKRKRLEFLEKGG